MARDVKRKRYIIFDIVAILHFFVGIIIIILGEKTDLFSKINVDHGGVEFIYKYIDNPLYKYLYEYFPDSSMGNYVYVKCLAILFLSSILYGLIASLIFYYIKSLFERD